MSSDIASVGGEGQGEGLGTSPGLDRVIVTLRVVDGLTEEPDASTGFDKVTVVPRVVVGPAGDRLGWAMDGAVLLCDAFVCWMGIADGPQNQPSVGAYVGLSPASRVSMGRKNSGDSKCARLQ